MNPRYPDAHVHLLGQDGNAGSIMGRVTRALKRAGASPAEITEYRMQSMSGDYDNLLATVGEWVSHDDPDHQDYGKGEWG